MSDSAYTAVSLTSAAQGETPNLRQRAFRAREPDNRETSKGV